ncbi:hypothetical protein AB433_03670 [Croceicoccus naphthovorans]|uniref:Uncharacterized protein n=1 Tax=Croceicoccus naphthovorans TaxID=1348774 RepID=A0A0G3XF90_9SPHN|nr:hypothetical protein AB433_03670 [Croceicoccus naphthovorans]
MVLGAWQSEKQQIASLPKSCTGDKTVERGEVQRLRNVTIAQGVPLGQPAFSTHPFEGQADQAQTIEPCICVPAVQSKGSAD